MENKIIVSGARPTGRLHLGNYVGAIRNFVKLQQDYECYFFVADYHTLTTKSNANELKNSTLSLIAEYLACGLEPNNATIYRQSDVPQIFELYTILNMMAYVGELERCTTFKDMVKKNKTNINAGLLTYPVLMAADILIHKASYVPVGKDQEQHLELCRVFAERFNNRYSTDLFPLPQAYNFNEKLIKINALDGSGKMGKSDNNSISLCEDSESIRKKVMKALTDSGPKIEFEVMSEPVQNLFNIMKIVSTSEVFDNYLELYNSCKIHYGHFKKQLAEDIISFLNPIKEKTEHYLNHPHIIHEVINSGGQKAYAHAEKTILELREIIGISKY